MSELAGFNWDTYPVEVQSDARHWAGSVAKMPDGREERNHPSAVVLQHVVELEELDLNTQF